jgi:hypothetical protein
LDKNACNAIEEKMMIAYYKSALIKHIIQPIKDEVADLYLRYVPFILNPQVAHCMNCKTTITTLPPA